jgi:hypothetical protein
MIITVIMSCLHLACAPQKETGAWMVLPLQVARDRSWARHGTSLPRVRPSSHRCFERIGAILQIRRIFAATISSPSGLTHACWDLSPSAGW